MLSTIIIMAILIASVAAIAVQESQAKPFFTKKTNNKIIGIIKVDSDCWDEHYARATPKNNNQVLLNKETIENNDRPDAGLGEAHKFVWYYDINKIKKTADTNENKIRTYVEIELTDAITGETVTKYKTIEAGKKSVDFGVFNLHTDKSLCE